MIKSLFNSRINANQVSISLLIVRVSFGAMMLTHGYGKFMRLLDGNLKFGDPLGIGSELSFVLVVLAEFFASITLMMGLATRISSFMLAFTMFVAGVIVHDEDPFGKKEKAFMYLAVFIGMMITGGGKYSIDSKID